MDAWEGLLMLVWPWRQLRKLEAERARLEQIVIAQQGELKKLDTKWVRAQEQVAEAGRKNAVLNRQLQKAERKARKEEVR